MSDETQKNKGQGAVLHPETDRRLKENEGDHGEGNNGQGAVKHPETDGRLKQNK